MDNLAAASGQSACVTRPARTCASIRAIRLTGIPGARRRWSEPVARGKPILLSIGYAACHWCHVMAHESFEDRGHRRHMNELYVNIKVDREERPDLDRLYQLAQQMLTGRGGGWPLTMFLMHDDQRPSSAEPTFRANRALACRLSAICSRQVAATTMSIWRSCARLRPSWSRPLGRPQSAACWPGALTAEPLQASRARLEQSFDADYGGFGAAPKFPHPTGLRGCCATGTPAPR